MSLWEALFLGFLQGATEFLPVSSSGHLVLGELLLGLRPNIALAAALHGGTLLAVVFFYRHDLWDMLRDLWRSLGALARGRKGLRDVWRDDHGTRLVLLLGLGTLPTVIIALSLRSLLARAFTSGLGTSIALLVTGVLLLSTRFMKGAAQEVSAGRDRRPTGIRPVQAVIIGVAQGLAIFPGISRSGATLASALALGSERADAARFCFLLSVPAILGALVLERRELTAATELSGGVVLAGVVTAAVVGYLCLALLLHLIRRGGLHRFAYYVLPLGLAGAIYFLFTT